VNRAADGTRRGYFTPVARGSAVTRRGWRTLCRSRCATGEVALNASTLWWGLLFGSIGMGFFIYGRKQRAIVPLICGVALMAFPYFVSGTAWLLVVGVVLMAVPYFIRT